MDDAFKAIEKIGGLELEDEYPYKAKKQKCQYNQTLSHVKVKGVVGKLPCPRNTKWYWAPLGGHQLFCVSLDKF